MLREGQPLQLHATAKVRDYLSGPLAFAPLLKAFCGVVWHDVPFKQWEPLVLRDGKSNGLSYRAISLPSPPPVFSAVDASSEEQTLAFLFRDDQTNGVLLVAPDVFEVTDELAVAIRDSDAVLFDGTFWSEDELGGVKARARQSSAMGHLPIGSGSLDILSHSSARQRIYLHINNTNPILMPGPERQAVEKAGLVVGEDGMEFEL